MSWNLSTLKFNSSWHSDAILRHCELHPRMKRSKTRPYILILNHTTPTEWCDYLVQTLWLIYWFWTLVLQAWIIHISLHLNYILLAVFISSPQAMIFVMCGLISPLLVKKILISRIVTIYWRFTINILWPSEATWRHRTGQYRLR